MQPGSVISPGQSPEPQKDTAEDVPQPESENIFQVPREEQPPAPTPEPPQEEAQPTAAQPAEPEPSAPAQPSPQPQDIAETTPSPFAQPAPQPTYDQPLQDVPEAVSWTASEYIAHQKSGSWYFGLLAAGSVLAAIIFLLTRDVVTLVTIIVVTILFGVFASRKPRVLQYELNESGITIAEKHYVYEEFKSFSVHDEGGVRSLFLLPMKRFMPGLSLYYPPDQEDQILQTISLYLPHEDREPDPVDRLMKRVRF